MIYICDANGTIRKVLTQTVNQNSNKANEVVLLAPFPNAQVTVAFTLPNGMHTTESLATPNMAEVDIDSLITDADGADYGAWTYLLPNTITAIAGQVQVQFYIYNDGEVITTSPATINVAKGVSHIFPQEPTVSIYADILNEIARLQSLAGDGGIKLIDAGRQLPSSDINTNAIYAETGIDDHIRYYIYNSGWKQLNATFLTADSLTVGETDLPNGLYIANNKLYYIYAWQVYQLANSQDIANLTAQITALSGAVATASTKATNALTTANNAQATASNAQTTATNANTTATEALNKANSLTTALRFMGNLTTIASLPTPSATTLGEVYNITDAFTTTADFILGAGREYPAGTNVAIVQKVTNGVTEYKYDALSGLIDLSGYQTKIVGEVTINVSQITSSESSTEISLTDAQFAVFQNCDVVVVNGEALGIGVNNFYKGLEVEPTNTLVFSQTLVGGGQLLALSFLIDTSTKIANFERFALSFSRRSNNAVDEIYLNGSYPINDYRIAETTTADAGKYLTVDSSGNIVWASLPIYEGETEETPTGFSVTYKAGELYFAGIPSYLKVNLTFADGTTASYNISGDNGTFPSDWEEQTGQSTGSMETGNGYTWRNVVSVVIKAYAPYAPDSGPYVIVNAINVGATYTADLTEDITIYSDGGEF